MLYSKGGAEGGQKNIKKPLRNKLFFVCDTDGWNKLWNSIKAVQLT